ncbi:hypothetical protein BB560_003648 [Smittium megazygosporum]|uniref:Uncharacterized protein n=1 Tax=Smittium megazygosporum TaxID=133381 RepID=A0A2T9ZBH6_9FUNG|nr:hypothetical protein BB560_003648 [Smittium megazygosporum]
MLINSSGLLNKTHCVILVSEISAKSNLRKSKTRSGYKNFGLLSTTKKETLNKIKSSATELGKDQGTKSKLSFRSLRPTKPILTNLRPNIRGDSKDLIEDSRPKELASTASDSYIFCNLNGTSPQNDYLIESYDRCWIDLVEEKQIKAVYIKNIRLEESKGLDIYLNFDITPIIETSSGIRFCNYKENDSGKNATQFTVNDFNWLKKHKSPNWTTFDDNDPCYIDPSNLIELNSQNKQKLATLKEIEPLSSTGVSKVCFPQLPDILSKLEFYK